MDTYAQVLQRVFVEFPEESPHTASSIAVRNTDADAARSENNISQWKSYLPQDCIETMIAMGWDVTT